MDREKIVRRDQLWRQVSREKLNEALFSIGVARDERLTKQTAISFIHLLDERLQQDIENIVRGRTKSLYA